MYSPQTFSVMAAIVVPAVVICLNSLMIIYTATLYLIEGKQQAIGTQ